MPAEKSKVELTGNYSWKYMNFQVDEKSTMGFYLPVVEDVNGDRLYIKHKASRFGIITTETVGQALVAAEEYLERVGVERKSCLKSEDAEGDEY